VKKLIRSPIFWGVVITPLVMYVAFWSGADLHGNYVAARWLLPFACFAMILGRPVADATVLFALFQFAAYGWFVSGRRWKMAGAIVVVIHLIFVAMDFALPYRPFS